MTAVATGTASDYLDLFERFRTFITSHSALVSAGENWTELRYNTTEVGTGRRLLMLRGPGTAGTDQIFVNLHTDFSVASDYYNWRISGAAGYNAGAGYADQPGQYAGSGVAGFSGFYMRLWNSSMPYWFIADGRCFKIIVKVSTNYQHMYGGFFLPYGTPNEYPYPLYIGAMGQSTAFRWSDTTSENWAHWRGHRASASRWLDGTWERYESVGNSYNPIHPNVAAAQPLIWPKSNFQSEGPGYSGTYRLHSLSLFRYFGSTESVGSRLYGILPGIFHVSGVGNASENTLTIGGKQYLVVQSSFRTGPNDYVAYLLE